MRSVVCSITHIVHVCVGGGGGGGCSHVISGMYCYSYYTRVCMCVCVCGGYDSKDRRGLDGRPGSVHVPHCDPFFLHCFIK